MVANSVRIAAIFNRAWLAVLVLVLVLGLTTIAPAPLRGEEAAGKEWIGQRVVPNQRNFKLRDAQGTVERAAKIAIYRVDQVKGNALGLTPDGGPIGWADAGQVVPIERAVEFFSNAISRSPRDPHNYAMRAMILLVGTGRRRARAGRL